ncbi:MAG: hypothetical protein IJM79_09000 [Erysipelotrichaceae bacterium]|nr:hypothetical protein [Erysipelotrichaceae bacterium]
MKDTKMAVRMIALLSIQHMLVDFMCAYGLYHDSSIPFAGYVTYNFLAFVLQFPFGVLADHLTRKNRDRLLGSVMMVIAGTLLTVTGSWYAPVLAGLGNALFHVGGGILAIKEDDRSHFRGRALGVFVAPGAIGLFMGMLLSRSSAYAALKIAVSLIMLAMSLLIGVTYSVNSPNYHPTEGKEGKVVPVALCCFAVVALRSLVGLGIAFPWKTTTLLSVLSVICLASGKTLGGLVAARFGMKKTIVVSLLASAICYLLGNNAIFGLLALVLFNMTMPLTLYLLAKTMPDQPGAAFGILTVALFVGYLPTAYRFISQVSPVILGSVSSLVSLVVLLWVVRMCGDDLA